MEHKRRYLAYLMFVLILTIQLKSTASKGCTKRTETHHKSLIKFLQMTHVQYKFSVLIESSSTVAVKSNLTNFKYTNWL